MNTTAAVRLFSDALYDLKQVLEMEKTLTVRSFPLKTRLRFKGQFIEREFSAPNVVGLLPGTYYNADDSFIILSAHYDHLGIAGRFHLQRGVMDNAIGVAAMLEIAHVLKKHAPPLKRSIIFLFTTGEEEGLLGATYYTDHPLVPLYRTVVNINIDGLAMFDRFRDVVGVGSELSTLVNYFKKVAAKQGYYVSSIPPQFGASESFARSDQIAFAKAGIPAILIAKGLDGHQLSRLEMLKSMFQCMKNIYHFALDCRKTLSLNKVEIYFYVLI